MSLIDTNLFSPELVALINRDFKHNWGVMQRQLTEATYLSKTYVTMDRAAEIDALPFSQSRRRHVKSVLNAALAHHGLTNCTLPQNAAGELVLPMVVWRTFLKGALTVKAGRQVDRHALRLTLKEE